MRRALGLVVAATALFASFSQGALPPPSSLRVEPTNHKVSCDPTQWKLPIDGIYNTSSDIDATKLNVHLIPHSHDDPGWLINVDEYYVQRVQYILDTVVSELQRDPHRKFMFVEQSFFQRWWHQQSNEIKEITRQLVREGRLDLTVNGGWCMHDEAAPHYIAMIDQTAYGHALLKQEFNVTPRIGWQIDPFGHSSTQGSLLSAGVGFEALYFARIDYQDYNRRYNEKDLEFIWRPSISRGKTMQTFTGQMIDHYGAPGHFHYDNDPPIQDDPMLHDFNVCEVVNWFVDDAKKRGDHSKGNHIFIPMGDDFSYVNARKWYKNLDKLIHYVNQDGRVNAFYSNLSYYTDLKRDQNLTWSVKKDDFFPYGSDRDEYWSGYFTSRPALKKYARVANQLLQQVRQIDAIYPSHHPADLNALERAVGVVQHHDGISGTEKQAVSDDYSLRLNDGIVAGVKALNQVLFVIGEKEEYSVCLQANASICDIGNLTEKFEVYVHNALPRPVTRTISIPVSHKAIHVTSLSGSSDPKNVAIYRNLVVRPHTLKELPYKVVFSAELQPLSAHRFLIQQLNSPMESQVEEGEREEKEEKSASTVTLENELVSVKICTTTGSIVSMTNKQKKITIPLSLEVAYYKAFQGDGRHSGAYMFRPDSKNVYRLNKTEQIQLIPNGIIDPPPSQSNTRIAFKLDNWATLEYILNDDDDFLQVEWTVGPIPIEDHQGKEVILRFDTNQKIQSAGKLYTDSNGLEFVTRVRNHRDTWDLQLHDDQERVAANYFPIAAAAYLKDASYQLNIVTDRAQGAASLSDGQVEIMVHRRLLMDDQKGVDQNLNETETLYDPIAKKMKTTGLIARGSLYLNIDTAQDGMQSLRQKMEAEFFQPLIAFRKPLKDQAVQEKVPWLTISAFPENVGLTTLTERTKNSLLIRLSHLFASGEHEKLSQTVAFDFNNYFHAKNQIITDVTELTLVGTATLEETPSIKNLEWNVEGEDQDEENELASIPLQGTVVQLQAMEVRTFQVTFGKKDEVESITNEVESITEEVNVLNQVEMEKTSQVEMEKPSRISIEQIVAFE